MVNRNCFYFLLLIVLSNCQSSKNTLAEEIPDIGNNILMKPPNFSLNYNKNISSNNIITKDSRHYVSPVLVENVNCAEPLTEITFFKALDLLQKETNLLKRYDLAKKIIEYNCITSFQIKRMGDLFAAELNKINLYEFAYQYCYDQQNYFILEKELVLKQNKERFKKIK